MEPFTISELGLFISGLITGLAGLIYALQKSRCDKIDCCCVKCHRVVPPPDPEPDEQDPPQAP
jgi:hypothetical protein